MHSDNMYIVCDDVKGFNTNFENTLDELARNGKPKPGSRLKKLSEHIECVYYTGAVMNDTFRIKKCNKLSPGKLVRAMDCFIRTQNVKTSKLKLLTSFKCNEDIDKFNPDHTIYLTPQQDEAYKRKEMLLIGAAGTGKTALIKAKVIELAKSGDKIVIVTSAESNRTNFTNTFDNVQIWTPRDLENKFKLGDIVKDLREIYKWKQMGSDVDEYDSMEPENRLKRENIKFESSNVMNHLSRIVGVNVGEPIAEFFGKQTNLLRRNAKRIKRNDLLDIMDSGIANVMIQLEKNWEESKETLEILFKESHFFMDDVFYSDKICHGIVTHFALDWIAKKATYGKNDQTKYFWIAGDLTQLMDDEDVHFTRKYCIAYLIQYKHEVDGIREKVVCLDAVMRCSKSVFDAWKPLRTTVQYLLGQALYHDTFSNRAEYGFRYPGSATVLKYFRKMVDLVEDMTNRIKFLTGDKFLTNSSFAVLVCEKMAIDAVRKQFDKDFTQSIATFHRDGVENKIVLDTADNCIGLEWPVVFVIYSDLHNENNHYFTIRKYLAYSRCRVRLFVYPELPSDIFKHGDESISCKLCISVKKKQMWNKMTTSDPIFEASSMSIDRFERLERRIKEWEARNKASEDRIEKLEHRNRVLENRIDELETQIKKLGATDKDRESGI